MDFKNTQSLYEKIYSRAIADGGKIDSISWQEISKNWLNLTGYEGEKQSMKLIKKLISDGYIKASFDWNHVFDIEPIANLKEGQKNDREGNMDKVFIVHGHDKALRETVARFIESLGLEAIILAERPSRGAAIIEKLEQYSDVAFVVALLTPDDFGAAEGEIEKFQGRARQNVIFELGFFVGKLGRKRVHCLYKKGVELHSDWYGVIFTPVDESDAWKIELAKELKAAGVSFDLTRILKS